MTRLISSELLKLRSTRTALALIGSVVGLVVLIGLIATLTADFEQDDVLTVDLLGIAGFAQVFALILGILAVTTEFRHGTVTPTLIVTPDRVRLVLAKLVAHVVAGLILGILAVGLTTAIVLIGLSGRDIDTGLTNARTEGVNRVIKDVGRRACGFRNPTNHRRRVRFHCTRKSRRVPAIPAAKPA